MLRSLFFLALLVTGGFVRANVTMTRVPASVFVNGGREDFAAIFREDAAKLKKIVRQLFEREIIMHAATRAYDLKADFETYYRLQQNQYQLTDLNKDGVEEVVFCGYTNGEDDKEYVEIYAEKNGFYAQVYQQVGHILAFKIHPNTGEIILFNHTYPCCNARSHNIYQLRLLGGKIRVQTKYFLGRDSDMKGTFFPVQVKYPAGYQALSDQTMVRWSKEVITQDAAPDSETNDIIHYPKGTPYKLLASENGFDYVLLLGPPVIEQSLVVNAENLSKMYLFAWIRHEKKKPES